MAGPNRIRRQQVVEVGVHKLFAPPNRLGAIQRDAILRKIFVDQVHARVILVQAPAGHGKTTLLAQAKSFSEESKVRTGWLTIDEADNDPHRFFVHLQAVISSILQTQISAAHSEEQLYQEARWHRKDWLVNRLVEIGEPVNLFFDEFQLIADKAILLFMRELLDHLPDSVRIFIGSRAIPDLGLVRLVVNNQALVFRADELRFSSSEAAQFFAEAGDLNVRSDEVDVIYRQTDGWPAALQLFRLTLVNPAIRQSLDKLGAFRLPDLAEYLGDNVLALQTPEIQAFLIRTSLLTRLCAPLCNVVMGRQGSQDVLLFLERAGLFVRSLDPEMRWFKYHTLFSSFLQEQLRKTCQSASFIEVHRLAADWYRNQGLFEEAMHHFIAANEYGLAAEILDSWASRLIADAHLATVERWYDRLPLDAIEKRPDLLVKIAWALTFLRRHAKLTTILELLEQQERLGRKPIRSNAQVVRAMAAILVDNLHDSYEIIRRVDIQCADPVGFEAFELAAAANLIGYFSLTSGDFDGAREVLRIARAYSDCADSTFSRAYSVSNTGMASIIQGQLSVALDRFQLAIAEPRFFGHESFAAASLVSCNILALYETNALDAAEVQFGEFKDVIKDAALLDYLAVAYVTMSRIHDARGRSGPAAALLDEAESIGFMNSWPRLVRLVNWERVRRLLLQGDIHQAGFCASRIRVASNESGLPEDCIPFSEDTEGESVGRIRLAVHMAQPEEALRMLATAIHAAQNKGRVRCQIKLHVLEALARKNQGNNNEAYRNLGHAMHLAESGGFIRTFLEEGSQVIDILRETWNSSQTGNADANQIVGTSPSYAEKLLQAVGPDPDQASMAHRFEPLEPLTLREAEILMFLARGVSNKEMARRIYLSENTVKFHLKNIYSKLAVCTRLQAINAARQMGLI
jgi:LuxR family maltose regulon positive regulatory protein